LANAWFIAGTEALLLSNMARGGVNVTFTPSANGVSASCTLATQLAQCMPVISKV
jgi:hypothetical protein